MKIFLSWIAAIAGAAWGPGFLAHNRMAMPTPQAVLLCAYAAWALYWGAPSFLFWWSSTWSPIGGPLLWWPVRIVGWLAFLVVGGFCFCLFGGGLLQFFRHWLRR